MWPRTDLIEFLGVKHPIIQAPMAGSTTPTLAAEVSNAGGLGSIGCAKLSPDELRTMADELRALTDRPFNLNFFAHGEPNDVTQIDPEVHSRLVHAYQKQGLGEPPTGAKSCTSIYKTFGEEFLAVLLEVKPKVVSFHFGMPNPDTVTALRDAGCVILCSATTVAEARILARSGVDAIIAQGWEAGGHRGTFEVSYEDLGNQRHCADSKILV